MGRYRDVASRIPRLVSTTSGGECVTLVNTSGLSGTPVLSTTAFLLRNTPGDQLGLDMGYADIGASIGGGDFTVRGYFRALTGSGDDPSIVSFIHGNRLTLNTTTMRMTVGVFGSATILITGTTAISYDTWYDWSLTRIGGTTTLRINGVSQGTTTGFGSWNTGLIAWGDDLWDGFGTWRQLRGYLAELAIYASGIYPADYTPTFAPEVIGTSNPNWDNIRFLANGTLSSSFDSTIALTGLTESLQTFAPTYPVVPRIAPGATRLDPLRNFGTRSLSGVVDYITSPAAGRVVRAYDKASGILLRETTTAGDGTYSFPDLLGNRDYYVVALDSPPNPASAWDTDISPIVQAT